MNYRFIRYIYKNYKNHRNSRDYLYSKKPPQASTLVSRRHSNIPEAFSTVSLSNLKIMPSSLNSIHVWFCSLLYGLINHVQHLIMKGIAIWGVGLPDDRCYVVSEFFHHQDWVLPFVWHDAEPSCLLQSSRNHPLNPRSTLPSLVHVEHLQFGSEGTWKDVWRCILPSLMTSSSLLCWLAFSSWMWIWIWLQIDSQNTESPYWTFLCEWQPLQTNVSKCLLYCIVLCHDFSHCES